MSTELKPCPFCGMTPSPYDGAFVVSHTTECFFTHRYDQEVWLVGSDAVKLWNRRASYSPPPRLPIGTRVEVNLGKNLKRFTGIVTGHEEYDKASVWVRCDSGLFWNVRNENCEELKPI